MGGGGELVWVGREAFRHIGGGALCRSEGGAAKGLIGLPLY